MYNNDEYIKIGNDYVSISNIRKLFLNNLYKYQYFIKEPLKLKIDKDLLERIIFNFDKTWSNSEDYWKDFAIDFELIKSLDLTGVSFDNFKASEKDYTGTHGIFLNPQTIYLKNLERTNLKGVTFIGSFNGCNIYRTNFKGSRGAKINPQTLYNKYLDYCNFADVKITGHFNDCSLEGVSFEGAIPGTFYNNDNRSIGFYLPVPVKIDSFSKSPIREEYPYIEENVYDESGIINLEDFYSLKSNEYDNTWVNTWMNTIFATAIDEQLNETIEENKKMIRTLNNIRK